ncbi:spermidine synthase [Phocoenobacter uteri]|uniref:Spermidine synthase n=1 Tax=Phocoenobacter uteri TaxID=146806 RepID=A0A379CC45_9PAST|nr:fused MFS/spermidine synthase [Phocoenobacter uteri]MDG6881215.1 hypothetical protein [Phocoenobacter uteri]SUB59237.1 spermidine synthase [Phocoenobacter uteri]
MRSSHFILKVVFFLSGFSALIYQIIWQRMLFTAFGVDLESITIIISVFMAGLGIGAYFGGRIADILLFRLGVSSLLVFFAITKVGIGSFGILSPFLIEFIQQTFLYSSTSTIAFVNFLLLLFPTFLMGSTLPLLTTYLQQFINNIGENIGWLYFTNTLGAAFACFMTGFVLFDMYTLDQVIYIAGGINFIVAMTVLGGFSKKEKKND